MNDYLSGPRELAEQIIQARGSLENGVPKDELKLSNDSVRKLVHLAYHVSVLPEEGRMPVLNFFQSEHYRNLVQVFPSITVREEPGALLEAVQRIKKLAPAADSTHALFFAEDSTEQPPTLFCVGIVDPCCAHECLDNPISIEVRIGPRLHIQILGPAHIAVDLLGNNDVHYSATLKAGEIKRLQFYAHVPYVTSFFEKMGSFLHGLQDFHDAEVTESEKASGLFGGVKGMAGLLQSSWSRIVQSAVAAGHGAAFLVLPTIVTKANEVEDLSIHLKYIAHQYCYFALLVQFWNSCVASYLAPSAEEVVKHENPSLRLAPKQFLEMCDIRKVELRKAERRIAALANVDGCVVFDSTLRVIGFGAEIRVSQSAARVPLMDHNSKAELSEEHIESFGTRHRSAMRLCQAVPGTIAFVVSQDRELRIFASDENGAYRFESLAVSR